MSINRREAILGAAAIAAGAALGVELVAL